MGMISETKDGNLEVEDEGWYAGEQRTKNGYDREWGTKEGMLRQWRTKDE